MSKYWLPTNNYRRRQKLKSLNCNFIFVTQVNKLQLIVRIIYMLAFWQRSRKKCAGFWREIMSKKRRLWGIVNLSMNQSSIFKCSRKEILNCWNLREIFFWLEVQIHLAKGKTSRALKLGTVEFMTQSFVCWPIHHLLKNYIWGNEKKRICLSVHSCQNKKMQYNPCF